MARRAWFDLTGLPPTHADLAAFLADPRRDAYEQLVERLLASPGYGERWARHWMDVAHFSETNGYETDQPRENAWHYRDYLIEAFRKDKPHGLGSLNANLPTFIVLPDARGLPYNLTGNFTSGFLAARRQGTIIEASKPNPIPDLQAPASAGYISEESDRDGLTLLEKMNRRHVANSPGDAQLEARIASIIRG